MELASIRNSFKHFKHFFLKKVFASRKQGLGTERRKMRHNLFVLIVSLSDK